MAQFPVFASVFADDDSNKQGVMTRKDVKYIAVGSGRSGTFMTVGFRSKNSLLSGKYKCETKKECDLFADRITKALNLNGQLSVSYSKIEPDGEESVAEVSGYYVYGSSKYKKGAYTVVEVTDFSIKSAATPQPNVPHFDLVCSTADANKKETLYSLIGTDFEILKPITIPANLTEIRFGHDGRWGYNDNLMRVIPAPFERVLKPQVIRITGVTVEHDSTWSYQFSNLGHPVVTMIGYAQNVGTLDAVVKYGKDNDIEFRFNATQDPRCKEPQLVKTKLRAFQNNSKITI